MVVRYLFGYAITGYLFSALCSLSPIRVYTLYMASLNKRGADNRQGPMDQRRNIQEKIHLTRAPRQNPSSRRGTAGGKKGK